MKHLLARPACLSAIVFFLVAAVPAFAGADDPATSDATDAKIKQMSSETLNDAIRACGSLEVALRAGDKTAEETAAKILAVKEQFVKDKDVLALLSKDLEKKPVLAARIVVAGVRAQKYVAQFKKGSVVVGQIVVEDGKTDVEDVLAQMPILPEGYFVGEVGDLKRPIGFRTPGYASLDVPLEGKTGDMVFVGKSILKPIKKDEGATLKGIVALDGEKSADAATVTLSMSVPTPNTPHNGYSPRAHWPKGVVVPVAKNGEFVAAGLTAADYHLSITADGHVAHSAGVSLKSGEEKDAGTIHLYSSDVGVYIGKTAPKAQALSWEKDYTAALARAKEEKKPLLIMETATWCGWCKKLEKDTLDDPWVEHLLSNYVVVKAFEDKEVEEKYGCGGYPTLVFADSTGKMAHKSVGYMQIVPFLEQIARADQKLGLALPDELQTLADKKIISVGPATVPIAHATQEPDKSDAELKWAKGVAEDFLTSLSQDDQGQTQLLANKEMVSSIKDNNWFTTFQATTGFASRGSSTIAEEEMSPTKDEAVFHGRLEGHIGERRQYKFTIRVAKDKESGKWRVGFFTYTESKPVEKKP